MIAAQYANKIENATGLLIEAERYADQLESTKDRAYVKLGLGVAWAIVSYVSKH